MSEQSESNPPAGSELPIIHWVAAGIVRGKSGKADAGIDYCFDCCEKLVNELREEFPEHASEILVDGGYDLAHNTDEPTTCGECGKSLASYIITSEAEDWEDEERCCYTDRAWEHAVRKLDAQNGEV